MIRRIDADLLPAFKQRLYRRWYCSHLRRLLQRHAKPDMIALPVFRKQLGYDS
jgi:hypothetical protein